MLVKQGIWFLTFWHLLTGWAPFYRSTHEFLNPMVMYIFLRRPKCVQASLNGAYVLVCCNSKHLPVAHNDVAPKKMQGWWFNIIYYALLRVFPPFAVLLLTPLNQQNTCLLPVITPFFLSPTIITSPTPYLYKRNTYVAQTPSSFLVRSKPKIIWKGWNLDQDLKD